MSTSRPSRPSTRQAARQQSAAKPTTSPKLPLQFSSFRKDHFETQAGIDVVNQQFQQIVNAINEGNGTVGRVEIPSGLDVKGATVTGLGTPEHGSDAVSNDHVSSTYGYGAQRAQLDIGGDHALKGLTWAVGKIKQLQQTQTSEYDGTVNSFAVAGFVIKFGRATGPSTVVFPGGDFPNACLSVVAVEIYAGGTSHYPNVTDGSETAHQFDIGISGGGSSDVFWIAVGW